MNSSTISEYDKFGRNLDDSHISKYLENEFHELGDVEGEVHCEVKLAADAVGKRRTGKVVARCANLPCLSLYLFAFFYSFCPTFLSCIGGRF